MKPLKVAFLWHMHQPDYLLGDEYLLPWVRLHAIKDYYDFPALLLKYPNVKFNFNYAPSLFDQLDNILNDKIVDRAYKLSLLDPHKLDTNQNHQILDSFFIANFDNMIKPYPRYLELYNLNENNHHFSAQEILDLQVWYNLCWFGFLSKQDLFIQRLIKKGSNFSIKERDLVLNRQKDIIKKIIPNLKELIELNQIEIAFSPYCHPILPLIDNIKSANDFLPDINLDNINFNYSQDSFEQINKSTVFHQKLFNCKMNGMWPSEGSLSNSILDQSISNNISWIASDEQLLNNSLNNHSEFNKYFTWNYSSANGSINLHFRNNFLSDRIGFEYTNWEPQHSVNDFFFYLHDIRNKLIEKYGENILEDTCVNIILDGENCWEFYPNLGYDFLSIFLERLNNDEYFETVLLSELNNRQTKELKSIRSGSWINSDFKIWIGEQIHLKAWNLLSEIRQIVENNKTNPNYEKSLNWIYKAESSDWFWWYYSGHVAPNKYDFDKIFRFNLRMALKVLNLIIPDYLHTTLWEEIETNKNSNHSAMHRVSF